MPSFMHGRSVPVCIRKAHAGSLVLPPKFVIFGGSAWPRVTA